MTPQTFAHLGVLGVILLMIVAMLEVGVIESAYSKLGITHRAITLLLLLSIFGSYINIPIGTIHDPSSIAVHHHLYNLSFVPHPVAFHTRAGQTIIAINVGGAVIPILLSVYLIARTACGVPALIATALVTLMVHRFARIVPGAGVAVPMLLPGILAALLATLLTRGPRAAVAYIAGTLGCLLGADVLNLGMIAQLHSPIASIGGAGTFDGVFISGIIAVLLA